MLGLIEAFQFYQMTEDIPIGWTKIWSKPDFMSMQRRNGRLPRYQRFHRFLAMARRQIQ